VRLPKGLYCIISRYNPCVQLDNACSIACTEMFRFPGLSSRYFEEMLLALIGNQVPGVAPDEICGVVISIRYSEDILGIWNKNAEREIIALLRDAIKKVLQLPSHAPMEYKPHQTAIQDKSSFRNTQVSASLPRDSQKFLPLLLSPLFTD
jgi:hypothetical protein